MPDGAGDWANQEVQNWPVIGISSHRHPGRRFLIDVTFFGRGRSWRVNVDAPRGYAPNLLPAARRELAAQVRAAGEL